MKNKKRKRNGGFTLVELLATLAILSIVVSIGVGAVTGVINRTNQKAYETTKNNVEATAKNYIIENGALFGWFDGADCIGGGTCEYQCVTVKNLIDSGYFRDDILESEIADDGTKLTKDNVVYIERDKVNKTITHQILDDDTTSCKDTNAIGRIIFDNYNNNWEQQKKVRITYILYDLDTSDYTYEYNYTGNGDKGISSENFSSSNINEIETEEFTGNGTLTAIIRKKSDPSIWFEKKLNFRKIDSTKPSVLLDSDNKFKEVQTVTLTLNDSDSGIVGYYFGTKDFAKEELLDSDFKSVPSDQLGNNSVTIKDLKVANANGTNWYAAAVDAANNKIYVAKIFDKMTFQTDVSGVTTDPARVIDASGENSYFNLNNVKLSSNYYHITGWYTACSGGSKLSNIQSVKYIGGKTYCAKLLENKIEDATVSITQTATDNRFNAVVSNIKLNYGNVGNNVSYNYQWYLNGKIIPGATSSYLNFSSSYKGHKIHVEVTVSKPYYIANKFTSSVLEIPKDVGYIQLNRTTSTIVKGKTSSITFQITDHHGGPLSVECNTKLTCYITGKIVTVAGLNVLPVGQTKIDVFSAETATYTQAKATYTLKVTANSFVEEIK